MREKEKAINLSSGNKFRTFSKVPKVEYFHTVDALRTVGAIIILIWHYHHFYFTEPYFGTDGNFPSWDYSRQPLYQILSIFYHHGAFAVQFFWLLSGFIFGFVYLERRIDFKTFFVNRFSRLYPLHLATLLTITIFQAISFRLLGYFQILEINDLKHFILNLFYMQHWGFQDGYSFNSSSWSVSVEEIIYYAFWLICIKFSVKKTKYIFFIALFGLFVFPVILKLTSTLVGWSPDIQISFCLYYFFCGILGYKLQENKTAKLTLLLGILFAFLSLPFFVLIENPLSNVHPLFNTLLLHSFFPFFSVALLFSAAALDKCSLNKRVKDSFKSFGSLTYSTYMIHLPIQVFVLIVLDKLEISREVFDNQIVFWIYILLTCFLGRVIFNNFEKNWQYKLRQSFTPKKINKKSLL